MHIRSLSALLFLAACAAIPTTDADEPEKSDGWGRRLVEPVSHPTLFEGPVIESSIEPLYLHHKFPSNASGVPLGGDLELFAVQLRYALNDKVALIAVKDGWVDLDAENTLPYENGFANLAVGAKFAAYEDVENGLIVTPGLIYEAATGDINKAVALQGNGQGILRPFVAAGWDGGPIDTTVNVGYNQPLDEDAQSSLLDYHVQLAYEVFEGFHPLIEVNGLTYTDTGEGGLPFEGYDIANLGSKSTAGGGTLIAGAAGFRWRLHEHVVFGFTYEWPWTSRNDIINHRLTFDLYLPF